MLKRALYDYIRGFRWKNFVEVNRTSSNFYFWWMIVYLLVLLPVSNELLKESVAGIVCYYLWVIPFLIGMLGIELVQFRLPKMMFLCPMDFAERKQYMRLIFWVRILMPVLIELFTGTIFILCGILKLTIVVIYTFSAISSFLVFSMASRPSNPVDKESDKQFQRVCYFLGLMFCVIAQMCTAMFMEEIINGNRVYQYILIVEIIIFIGMDVFCLRSLPKYIDKNITYEECFTIIDSQNQLGKAR